MAAENPEKLVGKLVSALLAEQAGQVGLKVGLRKIWEYCRGKQDDPFKPDDFPRSRYAKLMERSKFNMLAPLVKMRAQSLEIVGYRSNKPNATNARSWQLWIDNRLDSRQTQVWQTAIKYGIAYGLTTRGTKLDENGEDKPSAVMTAYSPRDSYAYYQDPANDEWPLYFIHVNNLITGETDRLPAFGLEDKNQRARVTFFDDEKKIVFVQGESQDEWVVEEYEVHDYGVCPVVRYTAELDLEGEYHGIVEPLIRTQDRLNETLFDLLMTQTFNSFKIKVISGVMFGDTDEDGTPVDSPESAAKARSQKLRSSQDSTWAFADPDTKAYTLPETSMSPFIDAAKFVMNQFAIESQTAPQNFLGEIGGNLAAEALDALENSSNKLDLQLQRSFGESAAQQLRLAASIAGYEDEANDYSLQVVWQTVQRRSLAQVADALGKAAVMLQAPVEELWGMLPDVSLEDVERWKTLREQQKAEDLANQFLTGGGNNANPSATADSSAQLQRATAAANEPANLSSARPVQE